MNTSPRHIVGRFLLMGAAVMLLGAAAVYWGLFPIANARTRNLVAISIVIMAAIDAAIGLYRLTRS